MDDDILQKEKTSSLKFKISRFFTPAPKNDSNPDKDFLKRNLVRGLANEFLRNPIAQWLLIASLFINIADWAVLAFFIRPVDFPIILHYNIYFGVDIIGGWWQAYFLPFTGAVILLINSFLARFFYGRKERVASYVLLLAALAIQAGAAVAEAGVILINY